MDIKYIVKNVIALGLLVIMAFFIENYIFYALFISIHEICHIAAGVLLGYKWRKIYILPFGLYVNFEDEFIKPLDDIIMSLSGPLINFIFFAVFSFFSKYGYEGCYIFRKINLIICVFNLIPAGFLDGGRILKSVISSRKSYYLAHTIINLNGTALGCIISVVSLIKPLDLSNPIYFIVGVILLLKSIKDRRNMLLEVIREIFLKQRNFYTVKHLKVEFIYYPRNTDLEYIIKCLCSNRYYMIIYDVINKPYNAVSELDILRCYSKYGNISLGKCVSYLNT